MIKIDVDGADEHVLRAARRLWNDGRSCSWGKLPC